MRSIFFGTSDFAVPALDALASASDVVAVITQPDRPAGRGYRLTPTPVKAAALARGLRVEEPLKLGPLATELQGLDPDVLAVASYGRILPAAILGLPRSGIALNVHPSLLPLYRGATPLQSAIRDGRTETGVTIMTMDAGMDTGDVLLQERAPLGADETYGALHDRLARRGAVLLVEALRRLADGTLARTPQTALGVPEREILRTATRPLRKEDLVPDVAATARAIVDTVRSLSPSPAARVDLEALLAAGSRKPAAKPNRGREATKIVHAHVVTEREHQPPDREVPVGTAVAERGGLWIRASDGWVAIDTLIPPGRREMTAAQYVQSAAAGART